MSFDNKEALSPIHPTEFLIVSQYFYATMNLQQTGGEGTEFTKYATKCLHWKFLCTHSYKRHVAACCFAGREPTTHMQDNEKNPNIKHFNNSILQVVEAPPMISTGTFELKNKNVFESFSGRKPENTTYCSICISSHFKAQR